MSRSVHKYSVIEDCIRVCQASYDSLYSSDLEKAVMEKRWSKAVRICQRMLERKVKFEKKHGISFGSVFDNENNCFYETTQWYYDFITTEIADRTCPNCETVRRIMEDSDFFGKYVSDCHVCERKRKELNDPTRVIRK